MKRTPVERVAIPVYVTIEQRRILKTYVASHSLSLQRLIHDAVDEYLARRNHPPIFKTKKGTL